MNRDQLAFLAAGLLGGFLLGYLAHEVMAARQPPRFAQLPAGSPGLRAPDTAVAGSNPAEIERLRQAVDADPSDAAAVLALADANFDIENWGRAIELYRRADELRPGNPDLLTDLGICYRATGQFDFALEQFRRASRIAPGHWQSRFNEAVVLAFDRRDLDAAERVLDELRRLQPRNAEVERLAGELAALRRSG